MTRTPTSEASEDGSWIRVRIIAGQRSLETVLRQLGTGRPVELVVRIHAGAGARPEPASPYPRRLPVPEREGRVRYLKVEDIDWIKAERQYVRLYVGGKTFLMRGQSITIAKLASRLDPARFLRVHRSHIVNLDRVEVLRTDAPAKRYAVLAGGHDVPISQSGWDQLKAALGGGWG